MYQESTIVRKSDVRKYPSVGFVGDTFVWQHEFESINSSHIKEITYCIRYLQMEFNTEEYKRRGSNVFTSADGFKYVQSKTIENGVYLKCAIFRNGCKETAKLNLTRHLITPMHLHNHEVSKYDVRTSDLHNLQNSIRTCAELTKNQFGHVQN